MTFPNTRYVMSVERTFSLHRNKNMANETNQTATTLNDLDQELRRHISRLLEIACDDSKVADLIYAAIQNASRLGQEVTSLRKPTA